MQEVLKTHLLCVCARIEHLTFSEVVFSHQKIWFVKIIWMYFLHMYCSSCKPLAVIWQCD